MPVVYTKKLIKDGRRIGSNPYGVTVDFIEATDINNPIDFDLAQVIFDHYIKNNTENRILLYLCLILKS